AIRIGASRSRPKERRPDKGKRADRTDAVLPGVPELVQDLEGPGRYRAVRRDEPVDDPADDQSLHASARVDGRPVDVAGAVDDDAAAREARSAPADEPVDGLECRNGLRSDGGRGGDA